MQLIFVYGTLKRGNGLHGVLEKSEFVGEAITLDPVFKMFCNGSFPYVTHVGPGGYRVTGELFNVSEKVLEELDLTEGHPTHYRRSDTEFMLADGSMVAGQLYIYSKSTATCTEITSGCWFHPTLPNRKKSEKKTEKV